jgi:hypothetical protein
MHIFSIIVQIYRFFFVRQTKTAQIFNFCAMIVSFITIYEFLFVKYS